MDAGLMRAAAWRNDTPPVGVVVEVWAWLSVALAVWTGAEWRTTEGQVLRYVSHWRER